MPQKGSSRLNKIFLTLSVLVLLLSVFSSTGYSFSGNQNTYKPGTAELESLNATYYYQDGTNRTDTLAFPEQGASYIIFNSSNTIYAKNGETGQIDYGGLGDAGGIDGANATAVLLEAIGSGDRRVVIKGSPIIFTLDSVPVRTHLVGVGEVQIVTSGGGAGVFNWGANCITENVYFHASDMFFHAILHTNVLGVRRFLTDFPSEGGVATGTPSMIWDGDILTEGVGYINAKFFWVYDTAFAIEVTNGGRIRARNLTDSLPSLNMGLSSITGAVTTKVVTHGMTDTPAVIVVTPRQIGQGLWWVSARNSSSFTISFQNQPGASSWYFDWWASL